jgi:hypothetical protein
MCIDVKVHPARQDIFCDSQEGTQFLVDYWDFWQANEPALERPAHMQGCSPTQAAKW